MIDPPRRIAPHTGVDYPAIVELEQKRVGGIAWIAVGSAHCLFVRRALPLVFHDHRALAYLLRCEDAAAVNGGIADRVGLSLLGCRHDLRYSVRNVTGNQVSGSFALSGARCKRGRLRGGGRQSSALRGVALRRKRTRPASDTRSFRSSDVFLC